jgi:maltooligosyltrehalose trehalohydrolase
MPAKLGAERSEDGDTGFLVWAPARERVDLRILPEDRRDLPERTLGMRKAGGGYFEAEVRGLEPDARYLFVLDGAVQRPDPASGFQPEGVHGPSQAVSHEAFRWTDDGWRGVPVKEYIIYELHVGTFTPEGTFEAIIPHIGHFRALGITALELMPVAQFPGARNWGYDGVYPFAVQDTYGGPDAFKSLVNECHGHGISVVLDVVFNHLGPEGNYLRDFGPYFTDRYRTPWGEAVNFDGPMSGGPRRFFIENALHWFQRYHIDALRIDAVHGMYDFSARHFLQELNEEVKKGVPREVYLITESDLNDTRLIKPPEEGGYGLDAQWNDDFHHALHTLLTPERNGYYMDFGEPGQLSKALREGFVYSGQYSRFREREHGSSTAPRPARQFVVFSQNHDQVGNRPEGDRLSASLGADKLKLAAAVVLLSPYIPLIFMGEEYAEQAPFLYFTSHSDPAAVEAVRKGRKVEFAAFNWEGDLPDPQAGTTFSGSKIDLKLSEKGAHKALLDFYRTLIGLRKKHPALRHPGKKGTRVVQYDDEKAVLLLRRHKAEQVFWAASFNDEPVSLDIPFEGKWTLLLKTSPAGDNGNQDTLFGRIGQALKLAPYGFSLYRQET